MPYPPFPRDPAPEQLGRGPLGPRKTLRQKLVDAILAIPPRTRLYVAVAVVILIVIISSVALSGGQDEESAETVATSTSPAPLDVTVQPSRPVEMYIPALDLRAEFEQDVCATTDGAIDPDTMSKACTYTSD